LIAPREYAQIRSLIGKSVEGAKAEIKYTASPALARQTVPAPRNAFPLNRPRNATVDAQEKPLPEAQAAAVETELLTAPEDVERRKRLLRFYSNTR
jgi:hypothetical protein